MSLATTLVYLLKKTNEEGGVAIEQMGHQTTDDPFDT
jgi:hypothetical protein